MDTSEKYFKMCEKATEIQEIRGVGFKGMAGDWYALPDKEVKYLIFILSTSCVKLNEREVWLPRQDQLQEMLTGDGSNGTYVTATSPQGNTNYKYGFTEILLRRCLLNKFHQWCNANDSLVGFRYYSPLQLFDSMEKLWLAFVMEEKYNKIWNGEDWVIE